MNFELQQPQTTEYLEEQLINARLPYFPPRPSPLPSSPLPSPSPRTSRSSLILKPDLPIMLPAWLVWIRNRISPSLASGSRTGAWGSRQVTGSRGRSRGHEEGHRVTRKVMGVTRQQRGVEISRAGIGTGARGSGVHKVRMRCFIKQEEHL